MFLSEQNPMVATLSLCQYPVIVSGGERDGGGCRTAVRGGGRLCAAVDGRFKAAGQGVATGGDNG